VRFRALGGRQETSGMPNRVLLAARLGFMRSEARDNQRGTVVVSVSEAANSVLVPNLWSSAGELLVAGAVVNSSALFRRSTLVATALVLADGPEEALRESIAILEPLGAGAARRDCAPAPA
jgi:hypothetical protein